MENSIKIFPTPYILAEKLADEIVKQIRKSAKGNIPFNVALSGGTTPELLFSIIGDKFSDSIPWEYVHLFWGDERCVSPMDSDSNYGMTKRTLIDKINIPSKNVHRIRGEDDPVRESKRYSEEIASSTRTLNGLPLFDLIMLGLGEDGHTASIFPGHRDLFSSDKICDVAIHPVTGQSRITITGRVINNAESVIFLVTGKNKARVTGEILKKSPSAINFPAYYIVPVFGKLSWFLDADAAMWLKPTQPLPERDRL